MLTDDDLTRQLGSAFRDATDDLTYAGRVPTPRRPALLVAVPAAATVAAAATLVVAATGSPSGDAPVSRATPTHHATSGADASASGTVVTDEIEVAGFTLRYQRTAGEPDPIRLVDGLEVPADARSVSAEPPAQAWVGTDPSTGDAALWLKAPTRNEGRLFALVSSVWTQDQLVDLLHNGSPA